MFDNLRSPRSPWSERLHLALGAAFAVAVLGVLPLAVLELEQRADARAEALLAHDADVARASAAYTNARASEPELILHIVADGEPCGDARDGQERERRVECRGHDVTPAAP